MNKHHLLLGFYEFEYYGMVLKLKLYFSHRAPSIYDVKWYE